MGTQIEEQFPTHLLRSIDWNCQDWCRSVMACLVRGTYVQERARQKNISPDSSWWTSFHFKLLENIIDKSDSSIIGTIYQYTPPFSRSSNAPEYVITFRGTLIKSKTFLQDIKLDRHVLRIDLHKTSRASTALQAVQKLVSTSYGEGNKSIWLAGHSLGASLAMHVGKSMVKYSGVSLETFLFNPPYIDVPIESLIKSERVKRRIRIVGSFVRTVMVVFMKGQRDRCNDYFDMLESWMPHIFVNRGDIVCAEYEGYFRHREVMEGIGLGGVGRLATQNSLRVLVKTVFGKDTEPLHLLPSAKLIVNLNKYPEAFVSHGINQWWRSDLSLESNCFQMTTARRQDNLTLPNMSGRRRSITATPSPSPGPGGSGTALDLRPQAEIVPKSAGGFELEPSDYILQVSKKAFQGRMAGCWPRWDDIPPHIKNAIQADLLAAVRVDPEDMDIFLNHWNKKLRKNYMDTLSKAKNLNKKPNWMSADVWAEFLLLWDTPEAKELSARNSANRNKNPALHRGGSKSFQDHRRELAARYNREPTMAEVFQLMHAVETTDEEGNVSYKWTDDKSRSVMERYEAERDRIAQANGREELTLEEANRIWDAIIEPPSRTNRRYSYGNQEAMISQGAHRRSQQEEEIAEMKKTLAEVTDWRKSFFEQQLDERIAAFLQQHGMMPGEGGNDGGNDGEE